MFIILTCKHTKNYRYLLCKKYENVFIKRINDLKMTFLVFEERTVRKRYRNKLKYKEITLNSKTKSKASSPRSELSISECLESISLLHT